MSSSLRRKSPSSSSESSLVSVGMPVRNGGERLHQTIAALVKQSHRDLELVISDNNSDDATQAICQEWAKRDERIRYERQSTDVGPVGNFHYVLQQARGPFFMWAAHDDWWDPEFVAENLAILRSDPTVVCSVSQVEFVDQEGQVVAFPAGTFPLVRAPATNLVEYLDNPAANSRFYGLFRTEVIRESFLESDTYWAGDWVIMARTLMWGKHHELNSCLMRRGIRGMSSDIASTMPRFNRTWLTRRFPMLPMTWTLLSEGSIPFSWRMCRLLWRWNFRYRRYLLGLSRGRNFRHRIVYPALQRIGLKRAA